MLCNWGGGPIGSDGLFNLRVKNGTYFIVVSLHQKWNFNCNFNSFALPFGGNLSSLSVNTRFYPPLF